MKKVLALIMIFSGLGLLGYLACQYGNEKGYLVSSDVKAGYEVSYGSSVPVKSERAAAQVGNEPAAGKVIEEATTIVEVYKPEPEVSVSISVSEEVVIVRDPVLSTEPEDDYDEPVSPENVISGDIMAQSLACEVSSPSAEADVEPEIETIDISKPIEQVQPAAVVEIAVVDDVDRLPGITFMPFRLKGNFGVSDSELGEMVSDAILHEAKIDDYEVFDQRQLKAAMVERGFRGSQYSSYAASAANSVGVEYVVQGDFAFTGSKYYLSARIIDCESGVIVKSSIVSFYSMGAWLDNVPELVANLGFNTNEPVVSVDTAEAELFDMISDDTDFGLVLETTQNKEVFTEGENVQFRVRADVACYVTIVTRDSKGNSTLLLPNSYYSGKSNYIRAGESILVPPASAGYHFPIVSPHGATKVIAIATLEPLVLQGVNLNSLGQGNDFLEIRGGVKAIGIAPGPARHSGTDSGTISKQKEWALDSLTLFTSEKPRGVSVTDSITDSYDRVAEPVADGSQGANDRLRAEWERMNSASVFSFSNAGSLAMSDDNDTSSEMLVWYKNSNNFKVVERFSAGTKAIGGLNGGGEVVTSVPNIKIRAFGMPATRCIGMQWHLKNNYSPVLILAGKVYRT